MGESPKNCSPECSLHRGRSHARQGPGDQGPEGHHRQGPAILRHGGEDTLLKVSEPVVADTAFACTMSIDMTMKGQGHMKLTELCVYAVKNGKIVSEEFFY